MEILIPTPPAFSFKRTVMSHGWCELLPFEFDRSRWILKRVLEVKGADPTTVSISGTRGGVKVATSGRVSGRVKASIVLGVRHILRLDDEMGDFYRAMKAHPDFEWISREGAGRLLRSPTVFEDLVKTICTTNCSWALTDKMVVGLVNNLGPESADGRRAFPSPAVMAGAPPDFYRDVVRAGYRAPYLRKLAERVASGAIDVEAWLRSDLPTPDLKKQMKAIKGVGDYAAENLLKLLGRYDCLALDSWVRAQFARTHGNGRVASDARIASYYSRFDEWRGLALWCDLTRDWTEEEIPAPARS